MSFVIEQDRNQTLKSVALHSRADLGGICLVESKAVIKRALKDIRRPLAFRVAFEPKGAIVEKKQLRTRTGFKLSVAEGKRKPSEVLLIECLFEAEYDLKPGYQPTKEEIQAFQAANAIFNCWPFFREYANNTVMRMGLPPPPIPFLRLQPKRTSPGRVTSEVE